MEIRNLLFYYFLEKGLIYMLNLVFVSLMKLLILYLGYGSACYGVQLPIYAVDVSVVPKLTFKVRKSVLFLITCF